MPCRCDYPEPNYSGMLAEQKSKTKAIKKEADKVTRMLCEVLENYDLDVSDELAEWYGEHEEADKARRIREARKTAKLEAEKRATADRTAARARGLEKLTHAERTALGV